MSSDSCKHIHLVGRFVNEGMGVLLGPITPPKSKPKAAAGPTSPQQKRHKLSPLDSFKSLLRTAAETASDLGKSQVYLAKEFRGGGGLHRLFWPKILQIFP